MHEHAPRAACARRARDGQRGFSIIELLVILTVAMIGLTGLLMLTISLNKGNQGASQTSEARAVGKRVLEEARALSIAEIDAMAEVGGAGLHVPLLGDPDLNVALPPVAGRAGQQFRRRMIIIALDPDLLLMRVEIEWTDTGAQPGTAAHDHMIALEIVRDRNEVL